MLHIAIEKMLHGVTGAMPLHVSLTLAQGSFVALAGESGSGKTTLLRILAGLENATGAINFGNDVWLEGSKSLAPQQRGIGFVFQDYALFENMSVEKNLLFVNHDPKLCTHLLELTHLIELKKRMPSTLSGGQKQRVALCRALMSRPKLLLLDEPLSALDPKMRQQLQHDILNLHHEFGTTTVMVSHDPSEIYRLSDRVIMMHQGKVIDDGSPKKVLQHAQGSQKFSVSGEILEIIKADVIHIAIIAIGSQIVEVALSSHEAAQFHLGDRVAVSTKAFAPTLSLL